MKNLVIITTQYFENYNVGPDGFNTMGDGTPHWKPKGESLWQIEMDADLLMMSDPHEVFGRMIAKHNNEAERFEYITHDVRWSEPHVLGTEEDYIQAHKEVEV